MSYVVIYINYHDVNYVDNNLSLNLKKNLDQYNISSKIELLFKNKNESKRYCEAKELFDSAYALSKKKDHRGDI